MLSRIIRSKESVKSLSFGRLAHQPSEADLQAQQETLATAHTQAAHIVERAHADADAIRNEARELGYKEGLERASVETAQALQVVAKMVREASEQKWKVVHGAEADIVELALEIAEKVIAEHVKVSPATVANVARKALMLAVERENLAIRVNPDDLETIKTTREELMSAMDGIKKIEVIADRRVRSGGCVIETNAGNIDARVDSQLNEIEQSLRGAIDFD